MHQIKIFLHNFNVFEVEENLNKWLVENKDITIHEMKIDTIETHRLCVIVHYENKKDTVELDKKIGFGTMLRTG